MEREEMLFQAIQISACMFNPQLSTGTRPVPTATVGYLQSEAKALSHPRQ